MDLHDLYIPEQDWRKLLAAASGDAALLYLYIQAGGQPNQAEGALRMSTPRLDCAAACLKSCTALTSATLCTARTWISAAG